MKRVIEDVTVIDQQVGQLYEEGQKKVRSSDSSRTFGHRSRSMMSGNNTSGNLDSSLASNIQKLFSERIDYFAPVTSSKVRTLHTKHSLIISIFSPSGLHTDRNHQIGLKNSAGVRPSEDIRQIRTAADAGGLSLPPALSLAVCGGRGGGDSPSG